MVTRDHKYYWSSSLVLKSWRLELWEDRFGVYQEGLPGTAFLKLWLNVYSSWCQQFRRRTVRTATNYLPWNFSTRLLLWWYLSFLLNKELFKVMKVWILSVILFDIKGDNRSLSGKIPGQGYLKGLRYSHCRRVVATGWDYLLGQFQSLW